MLDENVNQLASGISPIAPVATGMIIAVSRSSSHNFSKATQPSVELVTGLGVLGDAHLGVTVQHVVRVKEDPTKPNLRQVHLMHSELFEELSAQGFTVLPGQLGENVTTRGINLLELPKDTRLHLGDTAVVQITGLRNPCRQLDRFQPGLMGALLDRDTDGKLVRKSGIMGVVLSGGRISAGDVIRVELPAGAREPLDRV
jgi:MOSC domain-containing protein YiiM